MDETRFPNQSLKISEALSSAKVGDEIMKSFFLMEDLFKKMHDIISDLAFTRTPAEYYKESATELANEVDRFLGTEYALPEANAKFDWNDIAESIKEGP